MRRLGVQVRCEPVIEVDGRTLRLALMTEMVTFEGFLQPDGTLNGGAAAGGVESRGNEMWQPLFGVFYASESTTVQRGQCLILGGQVALAGPAGALPAAVQKAAEAARAARCVFFFVEARIITL